MSKICCTCKKLKSITDFTKDRSSKDGTSARCRNCNKIYNNKFYKINRNKILNDNKHYHNSLKGRYSQYKRNAKSKNLEFSISLKDFSKFWQQPCHYCGNTIATIGLDRINNEKGYIIENLASCCYTCNKMKGILSCENFTEHIRKITKWLNYYELAV